MNKDAKRPYVTYLYYYIIYIIHIYAQGPFYIIYLFMLVFKFTTWHSDRSSSSRAHVNANSFVYYL